MSVNDIMFCSRKSIKGEPCQHLRTVGWKGSEKWLDSHFALSTVMSTSEFGTILSTKDANKNDGPISFTSERE